MPHPPLAVEDVDLLAVGEEVAMVKLVARHAAVLGIRRYVQTHTLDDPANAMLAESRGAPEEFDGVAELWWTSVEDLAAATGTPEGHAAAKALYEDERRFIDHARSPIWLAEEHPVLEG